MFREMENYINSTSWKKIAVDIIVVVFIVFVVIMVLDLSAVFNSTYDVH